MAPKLYYLNQGCLRFDEITKHYKIPQGLNQSLHQMPHEIISYVFSTYARKFQ